MGKNEREHYIKVLEKMFYTMEKLENGVILPTSEVKTALAYAISSLKTDLKYDLMYEGEDIYTKDDMVAMLIELKYDLYHELCKEIHGKEDCPCTNQTTSCLATFRVCDADRAIGRTIQQRINELKEKDNDK